MTVPSRSRRGSRRPGWTLLTAMLVLAIGASSALVFTNRVELLKLAVLVALWAAVIAAFVSVVYRRQSDIDQARARDLKLVYDLQLDREISARREYELQLESQLRRELAHELRGQAADEVAALRLELTALRNHLEILFDADLVHRPALENERTTVRAFSDWERDMPSGDAGMGSMPRMNATSDSGLEETTIIDVPEEPAEPYAIEPVPEPAGQQVWEQEPMPGGIHRLAASAAEWESRPSDAWLPPGPPNGPWISGNGTPAIPPPPPPPLPPSPPPPPPPMAEPEPRQGRHWNAGDVGPGFQPEAEPYLPPAPRHRSAEEVNSGQHGRGQPVSELLARNQAGSASRSGRRRRRDA